MQCLVTLADSEGHRPGTWWGHSLGHPAYQLTTTHFEIKTLTKKDLPLLV
jgi:hypothetical protein